MYAFHAVYLVLCSVPAPPVVTCTLFALPEAVCCRASVGCIEDVEVASPSTVRLQIVRQLRVDSSDGVFGVLDRLGLCH